MSRFRSDAVVASALVALVVAVWLCQQGIFTLEAFAMPISYTHDSAFTLMAGRASAEGDFAFLFPKTIQRLGAPGVATWDDYPITDEIFYGLNGLCARLFGAGAGFNVMVLLGPITAVLAMYGALRRRSEPTPVSLAAPFALAFAWSNFEVQRQVIHPSLAHAWSIPLLVLALDEVRRGAEARQRVIWCASAVMGLQHIYYPMFAAWAFGFVGLWALVQRDRAAVSLVRRALSLVFLSTLIASLDTLWLWVHEGPISTSFHRNANEASYYALRWIELFMPASNHPWFASLGQWYEDGTKQGEMGYAYLGLLGCLALLALIWRFARDAVFLTGGTAARWLFVIVGLIFVCAPGGVMALQGPLNRVLFRSNNRVSVVILAILLFWAAEEWTRWQTKQSPMIARAMTAGLALLLLEGAVALPPYTNRAASALAFKNDREVGDALEARLPPQAMVFLYPPRLFPEAPLLHELGPYDLGRLYVHTRTVRFDFGGVRGRSEDDSWRFELLGASATTIQEKLKARGFAAFCAARPGLKQADQTLQRWQEQGMVFDLSSPHDDFACATLR
jgi:phosphoglycerol transferase